MENINKLEKCIERKKLSNDLNGLYNELKFIVKNNNKNVKIPKPVKEAVKNMVYSVDNYNSYDILKHSLYNISCCIPNTKSEYQTIDENLYISLVNIIANRINNIDDRYMIEGILDCLYNLGEISKQKLDSCDFNIKDLLKILEESNSKLKIQNSLMLLNEINNIDNPALVSNIIANLTKTDNENKLEQIYIILSSGFKNSLLSDPEYKKRFYDITSQFLKYIEIEKNDKYDEYLIEILKTFYNCNFMHMIDPSDNNNIIESILEANLENYDNENMETLIKILGKNFINSKNQDLRKSIIETTLNMDFSNDLHKELYTKAMFDVVWANTALNNAEFQQKMVDLLSKTKSTKALELMIDIYPFVNKYNTEEQKYNTICSLSDNEDKIKKLVIPIKNN